MSVQKNVEGALRAIGVAIAAGCVRRNYFRGDGNVRLRFNIFVFENSHALTSVQSFCVFASGVPMRETFATLSLLLRVSRNTALHSS